MEHKQYRCWSYESSPFIKSICIDKWVVTCYQLDYLFLMYGLDKDTNTFWMVIKFEDERSLAQVNNIIPNVKWKHYVWENEMLTDVAKRKGLITGIYQPYYTNFVHHVLKG